MFDEPPSNKMVESSVVEKNSKPLLEGETLPGAKEPIEDAESNPALYDKSKSGAPHSTPAPAPKPAPAAPNPHITLKDGAPVRVLTKNAHCGKYGRIDGEPIEADGTRSFKVVLDDGAEGIFPESDLGTSS